MPELSICMVSLNCLRVLEDCLQSLAASRTTFDFEVIIVDNGSTDGTLEFLRGRKDVVLIENGYNAGFTRATNQGIERGSGRYILWLNTDTILRPDSLQKMYDFLESHGEVGIVGPKVLNADLTFQPQCKRGIPTPMGWIGYKLGLDRRWPNNKKLASYLLRGVSEDAPARVDAVSGCCLFARRAVWDDIGPLDEDIFGFGEDLDWCVRADQKGWQVWYDPESVIVHLKGQGGAHSKPYHKAYGIHQCMWIFYRKHLRRKYSPVTTAIVACVIAMSFTVDVLRISGRRAWMRVARA